MNAVAKFVKRTVGTESSADIVREIEQARAEGTAARDDAAVHDARALKAASFDEAEQFRRKGAEARWRSDRAEARLPELQDRLTAAKSRELSAAMERHRVRRMALYKRLKGSIEAAAAIQAEALQEDQEAIAEMGEAVVRGNFPAFAFRGLLLPDLVRAWTTEMDRAVLSARPVPDPAAPAPRAEAPQKLPHELERKRLPTVGEAAHRPATTGLIPTGAGERAPRKPDDTAPLLAGEVRVRVMRAGYSPADDAPQCARGQLIRMPKDRAEKAVAAGVVEIVEEGTDSQRG